LTDKNDLMPPITRTHPKSAKLILILALPIFLNGIIIQLHAVIGRAFLGHLQTEFLTVIANATFPFFASIAIPLALTTGLTILIAQGMGAQNYSKVKRYIEASFMYNVLIAMVILAFWRLFAKEILLVMGVNHRQILSYSIHYLNVISLALPLMAVEMTLTAILQGVGETRPIMYSGALKVVISIALDYGLIFGRLGLPRLGYLGAGVSFVIAGAAAALLLGGLAFAKIKEGLGIRPGELLKFDWLSYKAVLQIGIPSGFELFAWYVATLVRIQYLNRLGPDYVAIFMIIYSIELFIYQSYDALAKAATTLVGQEIGAGGNSRAKAILKTVNRINAVVMALIVSSNIFFARQIAGIFTPDTKLVAASVGYLIFNTAIHYLRSLNVIFGAGIRALGDTKWMFYSQLLGTAMIVVVSYLLMFQLKLGFWGCFAAALLDELIRAILNIIRFFQGKTGFFIAKTKSEPG
jgi:putative MATE family efflux protein